MLESLLKIFNKNQQSTTSDKFEDLKILCGLMIEAANADGNISDNEINKISNILTEIYNEDPSEVEIILKRSIAAKDEPSSLYFFTSKINKSFSNEKKILLIETLWEIILADGHIHDFESNLIRRLAGLIYISDVNCGNAKKNAMEKINNKKNI